MGQPHELKDVVSDLLQRYFAKADLDVDVYLSGSLARGEHNAKDLHERPESDIDVICFAEPSAARALSRLVSERGLPIEDRFILALPEKSNLPANCMLSIDFDSPIFRGTNLPLARRRTWTAAEYLAFQMQPMGLYNALALATQDDDRKNVVMGKALLAALKTMLAVTERRTKGFVFMADVLAVDQWTWEGGIALSPRDFLRGTSATLADRLFMLRELLSKRPEVQEAIGLLPSVRMFFGQDGSHADIIESVFNENNGYRRAEAFIT